jgi:ATP-dependent Lon protease
MIRINIDGYKVEDKVKIAQKYLLRDLCKQFGFKREDIHIEDDIVKYIIANKVEEEQGVRNLRRALEHIMSNINLKMIMEEEQMEFPFVVSEKIVNKYVITPRNKDQDKLNSIYT